MARRLHSRHGISLASAVLALSWSSAVSMPPADAGQDRGTRKGEVTESARPGAALSLRNEAQRSAEITELLARVERQVADGRMWSPPDDNAIETFRSLVNLLPDASASDLRAMRSLPSRFEALAQKAEAAGKHEEAQRLLIWAQAFATLPGTTPDEFAQAAPDTLKAEAPPVPKTPSLAAPLSSPPTTADGVANLEGAGAPGTRPPGVSGTDALAAPPPTPTPPPPVAGVTARRQEPAPPAAKPRPQPSESAGLPTGMRSTQTAMSPGMVALLLRRGEAMERLGDISAARLLYGRAAWAGNARAAAAMGQTFDPTYLERIGARGVAPDPDSAASWYRKAIALGDRDAESLLLALRGNPPLAAPGNAPQVARAASAPPVPVEHKVIEMFRDDCQAITLKAQLGEEPSEAERAYLRRGCRP